MTDLFRIKICGIKTAADVQAVEAAGADAVGLNFYTVSRRSIDFDTAKNLCEHLSPNTAVVGLFVNAPAEDVNTAAALLELDYVQIHGDEPAEYLRELGPTPIIRALRCGPPQSVKDALDYISRCKKLDIRLAALLLDAQVEGKFGGTGVRANSQAFREISQQIELPTILAGGLTAANVADAITETGARSIDTSSGVESEPGKKDATLVNRFVVEARRAFG